MVFVASLTDQIDETWHTKTNTEKLSAILDQFEELELSVEKKNTEKMKVELIKLAADCFSAWRTIK